MAYSDVNPLSKQITILTGLFVVGMMTFGLALSYYKNILFDRRLDVMAQQNDKLREENTLKHEQLQYVESAQYKDKYAKQNFNRINPGEQVVILMTEDEIQAADVPVEDEQARREFLFEELLKSKPVIEHWELYLFKKKEIEEIKKAL